MRNLIFSLKCLFYGNCLFLLSLLLQEYLHGIVLISSLSLCFIGFIRLYINEFSNKNDRVKITSLTGVLSILSLLLLFLSLFYLNLPRKELTSELNQSLRMFLAASCFFTFTIVVCCMAMLCKKMAMISNRFQEVHENFLKAQNDELFFDRISESWMFSGNFMIAYALFRFTIILVLGIMYVYGIELYELTLFNSDDRMVSDRLMPIWAVLHILTPFIITPIPFLYVLIPLRYTIKGIQLIAVVVQPVSSDLQPLGSDANSGENAGDDLDKHLLRNDFIGRQRNTF